MLKIAFNSKFVLPLPENHRFPMEKYDLLPRQLLHEGTVVEDNFFSPKEAEDAVILKTHTETYLSKLNEQNLTKEEIRRNGFPLTKELIEREKILIQGAIECAKHAKKNGVSMSIAGGTHHAFSDRGEGFCVLNDQACATNYVLDKGLARNVLIVDLDVHQGNGTAEIFNNNSNVFTFSMHGEKNYPLKKEESNLDIDLSDGTGDKTYLYEMEKNLDLILNQFTPDFIFYQAGVDVLSTDKLGRLNMSKNGVKKRDEYVLNLSKQLKIPTVVCMGGGYSEDVNEIVDAHANTYRVVQELFF